VSPSRMVRRIGFYVFIAVITAFFALPMLWLVTAPFTRNPSLSVSWPDFTLSNFSALTDDPNALPSLYNSAVLSL
jgi:multiple sugar transport system permease protein